MVLTLIAGFALLWALGVITDAPLRLLGAAGILAGGFALFARDVNRRGGRQARGRAGALAGPAQLPLFLALCGLIGLGLVAAAAVRAWLSPAARALVPTLPYGVALAGAGLLLFPQSGLMGALS